MKVKVHSSPTHGENERYDTENSHDEKHASLVLISSSTEVGSSRVRSCTDSTVMKHVRAEEFHREE